MTYNPEYHKKDEVKKKRREYYIKNREFLLRQQKRYRVKEKEKVQEKNNKYYRKNRVKVLARTKKYYRDNNQYYQEYQKKWDKKNPEKRREIHRRYRIKHSEKIKDYRDKNKDKLKEYHKNYKTKNRIKLTQYRNKVRKWKREWDKEYYQIPKVKIRKRDYLRNKRRRDNDYRIACNLRTRFITILKKYTKTGKITLSSKYGIDYKAIIEHLKPFPEDLSNYEIHHIKPLHTFKFINKDGTQNLEEIRKAFAPKNHQLLTKEEHKKIHRDLT